MALLPHSVYGYANHEDVHNAIRDRLNALNGDKVKLYDVLQQAVSALININDSIPVQSPYRHLVANELEAFANGPSPKNTHQEPAPAE